MECKRASYFLTERIIQRKKKTWGLSVLTVLVTNDLKATNAVSHKIRCYSPTGLSSFGRLMRPRDIGCSF